MLLTSEQKIDLRFHASLIFVVDVLRKEFVKTPLVIFVLAQRVHGDISLASLFKYLAAARNYFRIISEKRVPVFCKNKD